MPDEKVTKVKPDTYEQIKAKAQAEGITMADAAKRLIEQQTTPPTNCQLAQFRRVLETRGLSAPRRADWVWAMTDVLPPDMLNGTKLEPYADARKEAELRCAVGDELYAKLVAGELSSEEKALVEISTEDLKNPVKAFTESE